MERLLEAVTAVVCLVSPEKVRALAGAIRKIGDAKANAALSDVVGTATAKAVVDRLVAAEPYIVTTTVPAEDYGLSADVVTFGGRATLVTPDYTVRADTIAQDRAAATGEAFGNVRIIEPGAANLVTGGHAVFERDPASERVAARYLCADRVLLRRHAQRVAHPGDLFHVLQQRDLAAL